MLASRCLCHPQHCVRGLLWLCGRAWPWLSVSCSPACACGLAQCPPVQDCWPMENNQLSRHNVATLKHGRQSTACSHARAMPRLRSPRWEGSEALLPSSDLAAPTRSPRGWGRAHVGRRPAACALQGRCYGHVAGGGLHSAACR